MFTQCPACKTAFRITPAQIRMGEGLAKCSKCNMQFDVIGSLSDIAFEFHFSDIKRVPTLRFEQAVTPESEIEDPDPPPLPSKPSKIPWAWIAGIAFMVLALIAQLSYFQGRQLVQSPFFRPWFAGICAPLSCELPPYRAPEAIEILEQRLDPLGPNRLEFRIVVVNGSRIEQAFPRIQLNLIQFNGEPLAQGVFFPTDYLSSAERPALMPVGKAFVIRFTILSPKSAVGGYHFKLI